MNFTSVKLSLNVTRVTVTSVTNHTNSLHSRRPSHSQGGARVVVALPDIAIRDTSLSSSSTCLLSASLGFFYPNALAMSVLVKNLSRFHSGHKVNKLCATAKKQPLYFAAEPPKFPVGPFFSIRSLRIKAGIMWVCKRMLISISNLPNRGVRVVTLRCNSKVRWYGGTDNFFRGYGGTKVRRCENTSGLNAPRKEKSNLAPTASQEADPRTHAPPKTTNIINQHKNFYNHD